MTGDAPESTAVRARAQAPFDGIFLEICWSRLIGVVNEQAAALMRTSFTSIVREAGDLSAGVFDRRGYMIAQAVTGTPGHINSMALAMKHVLAAYPLATLGPGSRLAGLAIVEERESTTVVGPGAVITVDAHRTLIAAPGR